MLYCLGIFAYLTKGWIWDTKSMSSFVTEDILVKDFQSTVSKYRISDFPQIEKALFILVITATYLIMFAIYCKFFTFIKLLFYCLLQKSWWKTWESLYFVMRTSGDHWHNFLTDDSDVNSLSRFKGLKIRYRHKWCVVITLSWQICELVTTKKRKTLFSSYLLVWLKYLLNEFNVFFKFLKQTTPKLTEVWDTTLVRLNLFWPRLPLYFIT